MKYLVFCTFDLEHAGSHGYEDAYEALQKIGLRKIVAPARGGTVIPTTSCMGEFEGASASSLRDEILTKIEKGFGLCALTSEVLVIVSGDGAWGAAKT